MTYKAKNKRISLLEFRAWLQGVEELQPKDWFPNLEQWRLIRAKIDAVGAKEGSVEPEVVKPAAKSTHNRTVALPQPTTPSGMTPVIPVVPPDKNPIYSGAFLIPDAGGGIPDNVQYDGQIHRTAQKM
jgi:hypothetical protein